MGYYLPKFNILLENRLIPIIIIISVLGTLGLPHLSLAQTQTKANTTVLGEVTLPLLAGKTEFLAESTAEAEANGLLPTNQEKKPSQKVIMTITAYSSTVGQTDDDPCTTASGLNVCQRNIEDIVATNFNRLAFGTKIRIPELFGDKVFIVHDRMNARYNQRLDLWFIDTQAARNFGVKKATVEIY